LLTQCAARSIFQPLTYRAASKSGPVEFHDWKAFMHQKAQRIAKGSLGSESSSIGARCVKEERDRLIVHAVARVNIEPKSFPAVIGHEADAVNIEEKRSFAGTICSPILVEIERRDEKVSEVRRIACRTTLG
jgi:hypothetical protein